MANQGVQLASLLDHRKMSRVVAETRKILRYWYPSGVVAPVIKAFHLVRKVFQGKFRGYQSCNTVYHDHAHTVDVYIAAVRLIDGCNLSGKILAPHVAQGLCWSALFHDIGYILETGDQGGTGAKYTRSHVRRSVGFMKVNHRTFGIPEDQIPFLTRLIQGTDLALDFQGIGYQDPQEHTAAAILATADLLGQMADRSYLEKLLFLYYEFQEAGFPQYETAFDVLKSTKGFYELTRKRLETELAGVYRYLEPHFQRRCDLEGNLYMQAIQRQVDYLQTIMDDASTNFRKKLKRLDFDQAEKQLSAILN